MTDDSPAATPTATNPWPHLLLWAGLILAVVGPFVAAAGADLQSSGANVYIGVTSNDVESGQRLLTFGQAAATGGLVSMALGVSTWARAWRPKSA